MPYTMDVSKFQELILYIADQSADDPHFGATKLNKLLFFSDFLCYAKLGHPLTGAEYQKLEHGPVPKDGVKFQKFLIQRGAAATQLVDRFGRLQERLVSLRPPQLSRFTAEEIKLVDEVIEEFWNESARGISDLSHERLIGWQVAEMKEVIPYETIFLSAEPLTESELAQAQRFATKNGFLDSV